MAISWNQRNILTLVVIISLLAVLPISIYSIDFIELLIIMLTAPVVIFFCVALWKVYATLYDDGGGDSDSDSDDEDPVRVKKKPYTCYWDNPGLAKVAIVEETEDELEAEDCV